MFSKLFTISAFVLAFAIHANAHTAVMPVLGIAGTPVRADVKRPNARNPCGRGVDIAAGMESSQPAIADASGTFSGTIMNFNRRLDGSRRMTAQVDPTGTGQNFVPMTITTNGELSPAELGTEPLTAQLPAGMQCTGGATGDKCLVQFENTVGFGNCMVVQQGEASGVTTPETSATDPVTSAPAAGAAAPARGGRFAGVLNRLQNRNAKAVGTRAALAVRAFLEELEARDDSDADYNEDGLVDSGFFDGQDR